MAAQGSRQVAEAAPQPRVPPSAQLLRVVVLEKQTGITLFDHAWKWKVGRVRLAGTRPWAAASLHACCAAATPHAARPAASGLALRNGAVLLPVCARSGRRGGERRCPACRPRAECPPPARGACCLRQAARPGPPARHVVRDVHERPAAAGAEGAWPPPPPLAGQWAHVRRSRLQRASVSHSGIEMAVVDGELTRVALFYSADLKVRGDGRGGRTR